MTTTPSPAALIGVPEEAPMSTPVCMRLSPVIGWVRGPNGLVIGPLTGQMKRWFPGVGLPLLPLAVGFGAELCSVVSLTGGGVLRRLGLRLFLPEIVLGVVELVLEAPLPLELPLEAA